MKTRVPPPAIGLICVLAMWLTNRFVTDAVISLPFKLLLAIFFVLAGITISVIAFRQFSRQDTTVNPMQPESATALVSEGIFSKTRNPMYIGLFLMLTGWGIWLANPVNIFVLILFVLYITHFQIKPEEAAMRSLFGAEYEEYTKRVRRWL